MFFSNALFKRHFSKKKRFPPAATYGARGESYIRSVIRHPHFPLSRKLFFYFTVIVKTPTSAMDVACLALISANGVRRK